MNTNFGPQVLLHTKLYRPRVTADLVHRARLEAALDTGLDHPLILVAAPAGFGKSTLASAWLETCDFPHAWLSLDDTDNDLGVFLAYFLAAVQTLFPGAVPETQAFLAGFSLPGVAVIASSLINELDDLGHDFILVLDDYHLIHTQPIHELLSRLLQHPPHGMHLVIVTRQDPQVGLGVLRAHDQVVEIRGQHLRFSNDEVAEFVGRALGKSVTDEALAVLTEKTEGWAAGLRLAMLTLRHSEDVGGQLAGLHAENRHVLDYLTHEVLSHVPPAMRSFLLKTSILDQVCGPLAKAVVGPEDPECQPQACLAWLEQANLFTLALDSRGEWYRYHQLFQGLLRDELAREASAGEIATLHTRASAWFARQGALEEAMHHALLGHDTPAAVRLLSEQRHALMDAERWQILERLLRMFPAETVVEYPDLLLANAWLTELNRSDPTYVKNTVDRAAVLLTQAVDPPLNATLLWREIDTMRAMAGYMEVRDLENVIALAAHALATTPHTQYFVRAVAWLRLALAYQMTGHLDLAYAALAEGEPEDVSQDGAVRIRIAGTRCFVEWMAGDLPAMRQGAVRVVTVAKAHHRYESLGWGHYFLAGAAYQQNDLTTAEVHAQAGEAIRYAGRMMTYLQSAFIFASICQARGQPDQAQHKLELAFDFLSETRSEGLLPLAQAFQAELAVRQGDLDAASHWATTIAPYLPLTAMPYFFMPQLTLPKFLLAQDTPASREQAAAVLSRLHTFVTSIHNTRFTIEVLALQALLHDAQGEVQVALALLQQALALAKPGGFIRLFADLGPRLANLLARLRQFEDAPGYADQVLQACGGSTVVIPRTRAVISPVDRRELVESLTYREHEVLVLLNQRLAAKEIARALAISPLTVKRHAANIYRKLQVNGHREAVARAHHLGLL